MTLARWCQGQLPKTSSPPTPVSRLAPHGMLGHRHDYMSVCRIQQTVPPQPASRERTQQIKFLADLESDPVVQPEMMQDDLLPRGFLRGGAREAKRDGYRQRPLLAPREVDCDSQQGG